MEPCGTYSMLALTRLYFEYSIHLAGLHSSTKSSIILLFSKILLVEWERIFICLEKSTIRASTWLIPMFLIRCIDGILENVIIWAAMALEHIGQAVLAPIFTTSTYTRSYHLLNDREKDAKELKKAPVKAAVILIHWRWVVIWKHNRPWSLQPVQR